MRGEGVCERREAPIKIFRGYGESKAPNFPPTVLPPAWLPRAASFLACGCCPFVRGGACLSMTSVPTVVDCFSLIYASSVLAAISWHLSLLRM